MLAWAVLPKLGWRWLLALSALPLGLLLLLYPYLPESPHWLYAQKRYAEAEAVLHRVAAINGRKPLLLMLGPSEGTPSSAAETLLHAGSGSDGRVRSRSPANAVLGTAALTGVPDGHALVPSVAARWRRDLLRTCTAAFATIFGPELRRTTLLLYGIWSVNALTYCEQQQGDASHTASSGRGVQAAEETRQRVWSPFHCCHASRPRTLAVPADGLVLLTTSLQTASKEEACTPNGAPNLSARDYMVSRQLHTRSAAEQRDGAADGHLSPLGDAAHWLLATVPCFPNRIADHPHCHAGGSSRAVGRRPAHRQQGTQVCAAGGAVRLQCGVGLPAAGPSQRRAAGAAVCRAWLHRGLVLCALRLLTRGV
jgi:hypothetical protein